MGTQPEQVLEDNLVKQLQGLGYSYVTIKDEKALLANLKRQLEKHNQVSLTDKEFERVLNHLNKGNVFDRAKVLRDKMQLTKDDGTSVYLEFLQQEHWCQNLFQVTQQVSIEGTYKNRYDVTLLVNGLPLVQIELKRRGLELKEAFNQVNRYHRHSFGASHGLFQYVQLFVISNGVNTKYYANNRRQSFKQTFYWADKDNKLITQLEAFTKAFLEPCYLAKMVTKYIVLNETHKILMVLRPYQYYATEAIIDKVKNSDKNGYIWHTTGSGKTLTSFKASQLLMQLPKVHKVVFVVDRKDLDYQTTKEFNSFSAGSIDGTDDTRALVSQLSGDTKLIVTTIQKLNNAIGSARFSGKLEHLREARVVFIFDECHRSQFGETHNRIKSFFTKAQMFGFTGTPIFAENVIKNDQGKRTTKDLFDDCLHKYLITDAIKDENVLKFSVEYVGRYREKEGSNTEIDIEVEDIDTKELLHAPQRLEKIVDYIIEHHPRKTHGKEFTGMFCVSSVDVLIRYYELFQKRKAEGKHNLKIATIFSYTANEEDKGATGDYMLEDEEIAVAAEPTIAFTANSHTREKLDAFIVDYNTLFNTKFSTKDSQSFYNYYNDISKRVKNKEIDLLLVVNMYLTGFDSPPLSTLYVDKNLKYHGLIQAYSRTNRLYTEQKSQGNIVVFRNLKQATDDAVALFSNKDSDGTSIFIEPYEVYVAKFNAAYAELIKIVPTVDSVNELPSEIEQLAFVRSFRELLRIWNILKTFSDFSFDAVDMAEQEFADYRSKYVDLSPSHTGQPKEKASILDDVDFELELIHRDDINVAYILKLLGKLNSASEEDKERQKKAILETLTGEPSLRSKRELIRKFIEENLPHIEDIDDIPEQFENFWAREQMAAFEKMSKEEQLDPVKLQAVLGNYLFTERTPLRDEVLDMLPAKPKLLERKPIAERITAKMLSFVETFISGMGARL
ncbi:type I restriction enzyme R subunit [Pontibacter aydingkolensis]|uniref:Type I restriction enzyme endonuclease subunit n=1 Tax=Pontibacter aydingkolensis TaxID=1911536 RepID=A0ABS7CSP1_9BACT|nr:type I restriction endonuclease subunit R [Pontibacter aydingkolensis]MBW7466835.1 type I restriction endonuclease subunit R [Pontibacter aydingkolensis]